MIFFGTFFFESLVLPDRYQWPFSRANAAFIAAFYKEVHSEADRARRMLEEKIPYMPATACSFIRSALALIERSAAEEEAALRGVLLLHEKATAGAEEAALRGAPRLHSWINMV